jgi:hypothetical protein
VDENLMQLKINVIEIQLIENYENISFRVSLRGILVMCDSTSWKKSIW